ncbi:putative L-cysteine desulfhydrase 1 [Wolffia australiana]
MATDPATVKGDQAEEDGDRAAANGHQAAEDGEIAAANGHQAAEEGGEIAAVNGHQAAEDDDRAAVNGHQAAEDGDRAAVNGHQAAEERGEIAAVNGRREEEDGDRAWKKARRAETMTAEEIRLEFAHHGSEMARVNNGSFGCCPASVQAAQRRLQDLWLRHPEKFFCDNLQPWILRSRDVIRGLINADRVEEVSIVDNATTAAAVVFQHVQRAFYEGAYAAGDSIVMLHYAYGSVKKSAQAYVAGAGGNVVEVPLPFPVRSEEEVVVEFRKALEVAKDGGKRKVRLAVIDHITSMPCVVIPVKRLTQICREEGVDQVFIDAAHAIGNVEVDVRDIGADFYASNLYKWFFCPPSAALLYTKLSPSSSLHHPIVASEYGNGLPAESAWVGARDYTPHLVVPDAAAFVSRLPGGLSALISRNKKKVVEMGEMLAKAWGTALGCPPEMACAMVMVGLPPALRVEGDGDAQRLRRHLREAYLVEVPVYYNPRRADDDAVSAYARISHQVYNLEDDYLRLRDAVAQLVADGFTCAALSSPPP